MYLHLLALPNALTSTMTPPPPPPPPLPPHPLHDFSVETCVRCRYCGLVMVLMQPIREALNLMRCIRTRSTYDGIFTPKNLQLEGFN